MLIVNTKKRHFKSKKESALSDALIMLVLMAGAVLLFVVMCISRKANIAEELRGLQIYDPAVLIFLFMAIYAVFSVIKHFVYKMSVRTILEKGTKWQGTITGTTTNVLPGRPSGSKWYIYTVSDENGRTVQTDRYISDHVDKFRLKICTVYEYKNRFYFTDFL